MYDSATETIKEELIFPNNYFSKNTDETFQEYPNKIDAYLISYVDYLGNGITIYVDKKLRKNYWSSRIWNIKITDI